MKKINSRGMKQANKSCADGCPNLQPQKYLNFSRKKVQGNVQAMEQTSNLLKIKLLEAFSCILGGSFFCITKPCRLN
ncbi:MAG: hypothetical protein R3A43_03280 [Bacteroidia bacterium]